VKRVRMGWFALWLSLAAAVVLPGSLTLRAQAQEAADDPSKDAAESRATSFQAVEGSQKDEVPGGSLMVGAYAFVLLVLVGYVGRLGALQSRTARELERLTRAIERAKE
jgi:hypothetical protein